MIKSLRTRLVLSHLFVIFVAMVVLGFLLLSFVQRYFLDAMEESLMAQASITAQALIPGATSGMPQETQAQSPAYNALQQRQTSNVALQLDNAARERPYLRDSNLAYLSEVSVRLSAELETRIRILDGRGIVLIDSQEGQDEGLDLSSEPQIASALQGQYATRIGAGSDGPGGQAMYVAYPVWAEERVAGVIYLSQPLREVQTVLGDLRWRLLASTVGALLLSGVVGLVLSRAISNPVRQLTTAASRLAQGDFDYDLEIHSADEIGQLGHSFQTMSARLRHTLEDLALQNRLRTEFVSNVSHELRTPLTSIKGLLETLREGAVEDTEVRDRFLGTIDDETERLIRLVNDLLLLSRADFQALNIKPAPVDVQLLARRSVRKLWPQGEARGIHLEVEAPDEPLLALADADRVEQVLVNLLDNAIKFSPPGSTVSVRVAADTDLGHGCSRSGGKGQEGPAPVSVSVEDAGIGIPAQDLPHIFERFYRVDRARSRDRGGSGLGLSIAQALVEAHGGHIWLESEEGRGTTVHFTLPSLGS